MHLCVPKVKCASKCDGAFERTVFRSIKAVFFVLCISNEYVGGVHVRNRKRFFNRRRPATATRVSAVVITWSPIGFSGRISQRGFYSYNRDVFGYFPIGPRFESSTEHGKQYVFFHGNRQRHNVKPSRSPSRSSSPSIRRRWPPDGRTNVENFIFRASSGIRL